MSRAATLAFAVACGLAALLPLREGEGRAAPEAAAFPGWPSSFEGRTLTPLPPTEREQQLARGFPGRIARFSDGGRELVLRWVASPTRQLHPAADCFRGLGYQVEAAAVPDAEAWHAFHAQREGARLGVREAVVDERGARWTDVSAWYWAALLGRTRGPWWAVTVAETLPAP